jgi:2-haloacid dehalogenase
MEKIQTVVFDLGGVLIDWNPSYVFTETYFETPEQRAFFFDKVCTSDWNENQDAGYPLALATEDKLKEFPDWEKPIRDFYGRWEEMLGGPIQQTVEIFKELKQNTALKTYALTNWSAETFPIALKRFDFLHWFDGRLVSGEEKTRKPFPEFYQRLIDKFSIHPRQTVFIDDNLRNIKAGEALGFKGIHFLTSSELKKKLKEIKLIS